MKKLIFIFFAFVLIFDFYGGGKEEGKNGTAHFEFSYSEFHNQPILTIRIYPSEEIIEVFRSYDVDEIYLSRESSISDIPDEVRENINLIISENVDDIIPKIKSRLKESLLLNDVDYSYMIIADRIFAMHLYYK